MRKRAFMCTMLSILVLLFCGCLTGREYYFLQEKSNISSIQIVSLDESKDENGAPVQTLLYEIKDIERFLSDFCAMDCQSVSPPSEPISTILIKIIYSDGEYELIDYYGQSNFRDGYFYTYSGYYCFDQEQFDALILKYAETEESSEHQ